jgi:trigger factor
VGRRGADGNADKYQRRREKGSIEMQVTETLSQGLKREYKVMLPATDLAQRFEGQLVELRAKARINGFRPGKVPVSHLKRLYGRSIMSDVLQEAVTEANRKIVEDNAIRPVGEPRVELAGEAEDVEKAFEAQADLAFTVAFEVLPKIEIGSFDDIAIERLVAEVPDAEVAVVLGRLADQNRAYTEKEGDTAVAGKGDKVTIDFVGKIDGEPFEGGSGTDVDAVLGSNTFIPGFEDQLEGAKLGESRTLALTFPGDYASAKLAGKAATFDVTVKAIAAPQEVKIDDDLAKAFGFDELSQLETSVKGNIARDYGAASRRKWKRGLLDALDKKYAFDLPEGLVAQEFETVWRKVEAEQARGGRSFEDDGTTEEAARADYRAIAERRVRLGLLLADIGAKFGIKVSDEEIGQAVVERARSFPGQEKVIWEFYRKNPGALAEIRAPLFEEKVVDHILSLVTVTDKMVAPEELLRLADEDVDAATDSGTATALAAEPENAAEP